MSYIGRDGQRYETLQQVVLADKKYKMIEEQNQLLEEQKALLEKQNEINAENQDMLILKIQAEMAEQATRQEHEKNMRLLKLCDDIGINKSIVDNYIDYIFNFRKIEEEDRKIMEEYERKRQVYLSNERDNMFSKDKLPIVKKLKEEGLDFKGNTMGGRKILNTEEYNTLSKGYGKDILELMEVYDSKKIISVVFHWIFIPFLCIELFLMLPSADEESMGSLFLIMFITLITYFFLLLYSFSVRNSAKDNLEDELNRTLKYLEEHYHEDDGEGTAIWRKLSDLKNGWVKKKMETLDEFRINHYNPKIDKILLDFGLGDKLNGYHLKYKIFSKKEVKATGSIEDYISFFASECEKYN